LAISTTYIARETGINLRRNLVMTVAAIVTMMVSLSALGVVLIMRQAITKASVQWQGGVQLAIFLNPNVTPNEAAAIGHELSTMPGVAKFHYVNKQQAFREYKEIFGGNSELSSVLTVNEMPPSYRVVPTKAQEVAQIGRQFQGQPGVLTVSYAQQQIDQLLSRFHTLRVFGLALAIGVMIGAVALIVNTIQLAIFSRRREVAVMKLVGATNWFIRLPFMLEGLVHGLVGAALAFVVTYFARDTIASFVGNESFLGSQSLYVTPHEAIMTGIVLLVVGAAVGALGSAFAVRRFLTV
jgi:cell division transport system permease protein